MKRKPNPDHKLAGYSYGVTARCSCGWYSVAVFGKGARADAAAQWHNHRYDCEKGESK